MIDILMQIVQSLIYDTKIVLIDDSILVIYVIYNNDVIVNVINTILLLIKLVTDKISNSYPSNHIH